MQMDENYLSFFTTNSTSFFPNPYNLSSLLLKWKNCPFSHPRPLCAPMLWIPTSTASSRTSPLQLTLFSFVTSVFPFLLDHSHWHMKLPYYHQSEETFLNFISHPMSISLFPLPAKLLMLFILAVSTSLPPILSAHPNRILPSLLH